MVLLPLIVNAIVIGAIGVELIAMALGKVNANELLAVSTISGLLTLASFKLSKDALAQLHSDPESPNEQTGGES